MITKRRLILVMFGIVPLLLALAYVQPGAQAQSATPTATTTLTLLSPADALAWKNIPYNGPLGGFQLGVGHATGYTWYSIDTLATFQRSCAFVRVYRVTPFGDLILHPSSCAGDVMTFQSVGTGHYIFYSFDSVSAAQLAQMDVLWTQRPTPTPSGSTIIANTLLLSATDAFSFTSVPRTGPLGGNALGVMRADGYTSYSLDTLTTFRWLCEAVRVYRVTPFGDLILHPSTCSDNVLTFTSVGTGHYIFYGFGSALAAQNAEINALWIRPQQNTQ